LGLWTSHINNMNILIWKEWTIALIRVHSFSI
jgi:hypothetical protein